MIANRVGGVFGTFFLFLAMLQLVAAPSAASAQVAPKAEWASGVSQFRITSNGRSFNATHVADAHNGFLIPARPQSPTPHVRGGILFKDDNGRIFVAAVDRKSRDFNTYDRRAWHFRIEEIDMAYTLRALDSIGNLNRDRNWADRIADGDRGLRLLLDAIGPATGTALALETQYRAGTIPNFADVYSDHGTRVSGYTIDGFSAAPGIMLAARRSQ